MFGIWITQPAAAILEPSRRGPYLTAIDRTPLPPIVHTTYDNILILLLLLYDTLPPLAYM